MTKSQIRQEALTKLKALPITIRESKSKILFKKALQEAKNFETISIFESFDWEVNTAPIISEFLKQGKKVVVPKVLSPTEMIMVNLETGEVVAKDEIDFIFVPCVGYFRHYRIGYGRGYYDRYLKDFKGETTLLAFREQETEFIPDSFDIPVKKLLVE